MSSVRANRKLGFLVVGAGQGVLNPGDEKNLRRHFKKIPGGASKRFPSARSIVWHPINCSFISLYEFQALFNIFPMLLLQPIAFNPSLP